MRAVPRDVNASPFNQRQVKEKNRASNQLPRSISLSDPDLIRSVLNQKASQTKHIAAHYQAKEGLTGYALTVPKKLAKRAVDRNRIKRLMREAYRLGLCGADGRLLVLRLRKKVGEGQSGRLRERERQEIKNQLFSLGANK
jgi:ribonuclease P protein component